MGALLLDLQGRRGGAPHPPNLEPTMGQPARWPGAAPELPRGRTATGEMMMPSPSPLSEPWRALLLVPGVPAMRGSPVYDARCLPRAHWLAAGARTASQSATTWTHGCGLGGCDGRAQRDSTPPACRI